MLTKNQLMLIGYGNMNHNHHGKHLENHACSLFGCKPIGPNNLASNYGSNAPDQAQNKLSTGPSKQAFQSSDKMVKILPDDKPETPEGYWWCPECKEKVGPHSVPLDKRHETCGDYIQWIAFTEQAAGTSGPLLTDECREVVRLIFDELEMTCTHFPYNPPRQIKNCHECYADLKRKFLNG